MPCVSVNLWDVIAPVNALPLLTDLHIYRCSLDPLPIGVPKHKLPTYIIENYAPTGHRFRFWNFEVRTDQEIKGAVGCALLFALVCPNFDYAAVSTFVHELFMAYMKKMITTDGFRPYATRLRRLLFGRAQNTISNVRAIHKKSAGTEESKRIKDAAKRKVAWQQASTMFETYSRFLELALSQRSPMRLHLVLKRMLTEHVQLGKPTGVSFGLLDRCAEELLTWILDKENAQGQALDSVLDSALGAVDCLDEISWRVRHRHCKAPALWTIASAIAHDLRKDAAKYTRALAGLTLKKRDMPLVLRILRSSVISTRFLSGLYSCVNNDLRINLTLATAFYVSAISNRQHSTIPEAISASMLAQQSLVSKVLANTNCVLSADLANSLVGLAHSHINRPGLQLAELALAHFDRLTTHARWPMGALATAIRELLALEKTDIASRLLEISAARDYCEFRRLVGEQSVLDSRDFKRTLLENELDIALCTHRAAVAVSAKSPLAPVLPRAAFFVPKLQLNLGEPGIADCIERYYAKVEQIFEPCSPSAFLARRLVGEAGSWCYRLQSAVPAMRVASLLSRSARVGTNEGIKAPDLLLQYTRLLRSFAMTRLTDRLCGAASQRGQYTCPSLLGPTESVKQAAALEDPLIGYEGTRRVLLAEYLRRGLQPPPEALAIFHSHLATNNQPEASSLARRILPEIPPSLVSQRCSGGNLAVQAYYEHLLLSCQRQPRRLLQLFVHIMGHHGVDSSSEFLRRMVDLTIVAYLRQGYFRGMGFFRLERAIVRCVDRPRFSMAYLNQMRTRFWAMHMFLRRRKYVPRFKLYRWQLRVYRRRLYTLQVTAIPSAAKIKAQRVGTRVQASVSPSDIDTAVKIFLRSTPRSLPSSERRSLSWMLEHQTQMVVSKPI
ncbi:hypothetical protein GGI20_003612 [Coemansia sp. BCRC 34301]|nr:hypothetical protein GGI20_003612 [Coemansia sp. BCRC 34301]